MYDFSWYCIKQLMNLLVLLSIIKHGMNLIDSIGLVYASMLLLYPFETR
jgi:hypothetical protein